MPLKISVALCTYNGATYLAAQLQSFLRQEYPPFELVVCDDQSTDRTLSLLEDFASRAPFPVHIHSNAERLGSSLNFEKAMSLCTGDAIALSDQDDLWHPHKLRVLAAAFEDPGVSGVFSDGDLLWEDEPREGTLWRSFGFVGEELERFQHDPLAVMMRSNRVTGMTLMIRRETLDYVLPIPADWVHDYWIGFMIILYGRLTACPEQLVTYRIHGAQQLSVPRGFLTEVRRRGVRSAFGELSRIAQQDNSRTQLQMEELLCSLRRNPGSAAIRSAVSRLEMLTHYLRLRSEVQQLNLFRRAAAIVTNWHLYKSFAARSARDRLVDLLAIRPSQV